MVFLLGKNAQFHRVLNTENGHRHPYSSCWERMRSFIASYIRKTAQTPLQLLLGRRASSLDEPNLILIREGSGPLAGNLAQLACVLQGSSYPLEIMRSIVASYIYVL